MSESKLILIILCLFGLGSCYYVWKHPIIKQTSKDTQQNVQNWTPSPQPLQKLDKKEALPKAKPYCPNNT